MTLLFHVSSHLHTTHYSLQNCRPDRLIRLIINWEFRGPFILDQIFAAPWNPFWGLTIISLAVSHTNTVLTLSKLPLDDYQPISMNRQTHRRELSMKQLDIGVSPSISWPFGWAKWIIFQYFLSSPTDWRTDRQKAMHMIPSCRLHRWAKNVIPLLGRKFLQYEFYSIHINQSVICAYAMCWLTCFENEWLLACCLLSARKEVPLVKKLYTAVPLLRDSYYFMFKSGGAASSGSGPTQKWSIKDQDGA